MEGCLCEAVENANGQAFRCKDRHGPHGTSRSVAMFPAREIVKHYEEQVSPDPLTRAGGRDQPPQPKGKEHRWIPLTATIGEILGAHCKDLHLSTLLQSFSLSTAQERPETVSTSERIQSAVA